MSRVVSALETLHAQVEMEMSAVLDAYRRQQLWFPQAEALLRVLFVMPESAAFREFPRIDKALYMSKVKKPMYLTLIRDNLLSLRYMGKSSFLADLRLMFDNCYSFHKHDPRNELCRVAAKLEIEAERRAVEFGLDEAVTMDQIKPLWCKLTYEERLAAKATVVRYDDDGVKTEAARKRLLEYLRLTARVREERGRSAPQLKPSTVAPTTNLATAKRPRSPTNGESVRLSHAAPSAAPVPLPQNKHHYSFLEELSPMHEGSVSPAYPSSA